MGRIKKLKETDLVGGAQSTDVYPITSTLAVYDGQNKVLESYLTHLRNTATFGGIATPTTNPGTPTSKVFYIAKEKGTYQYFGKVITEDEVIILLWDSTWRKLSTGIPSKEKLDTKQDIIPDLDDIRINANKGATALQSYTETDPIYTADKPTLALKSEIPDISVKVDKVAGKGLSTNDYTNEDKAKLDSLQNYDDSGIVALINNKSDKGHTHTVSQITDFPSIPSKVSELTNDSGFISSIPSEYVTDTELNAKGYLTEHQDISGKANITDLTAHTGNTSIHVTSSDKSKWNAKQDALTLTVKDNGNIVIANIQGQSKEFMPATPSGDPMHYAYVAAGAIYNDTGSDIERIGGWTGDTIIHKAGMWYLNELGDLTNDDMQKVYAGGFGGEILNCASWGVSKINSARTNIPPLQIVRGLNWSSVEVAVLYDNEYAKNPNIVDINATNFYSLNQKIRIIAPYIASKSFYFYPNYPFANLYYVKIHGMNKNQWLAGSPLLREDCILYMIKNEQATSPITITLHHDAYTRAMANAEIVAAIQEHTNISLADAGAA